MSEKARVKKSTKQSENQVAVNICISSNVELVRNRWVRKRRVRQKFPGEAGNSSSATAVMSGMRFLGT